MADPMVRPCGGSWAYCSGNCGTCPRKYLTASSTTAIATSCMICGEEVPIPYGDSGQKVCEKCKAAVMMIRKGMVDPYGMVMD